MQQQYTEEMTGEHSELSDDDLYFNHVIQEDHELLALDMMLRNALSQTDE
jgi:hypothetical protein